MSEQPYTAGERLMLKHTDKDGRVRRSPVTVEACEGPTGDPHQFGSYRLTVKSRGFKATLPTDVYGTTRNGYLERVR